MKRSYLLTIEIFLLTLAIFSISLAYAQEPQQVNQSPNLSILPQEVKESPILDVQEEGPRCMPVKPDELEGVSGEELIQRWQNYTNCKGIDLDSPLGSSCQLDNKIWSMSSYEIVLSKGLDADLKDYLKKASNEHPIPVIIQIKCDLSTNDLIELINLGQRYYKGSALQNNAYLTFIPAKNIEKIANKQYVEGLTLFKPSFKYNKIPSTDEKVETYVYTIEETKPLHESDLKEIGIDMISYDDTLKLYVVKMSSSQYDDVANLEWTKLITTVPESIPMSQLIESTNKADNYIVSDSASQETDNSNWIIYVVVGIIFVIIMIFVILKIRKK